MALSASPPGFDLSTSVSLWFHVLLCLDLSAPICPWDVSSECRSALCRSSDPYDPALGLAKPLVWGHRMPHVRFSISWSSAYGTPRVTLAASPLLLPCEHHLIRQADSPGAMLSAPHYSVDALLALHSPLA